MQMPIINDELSKDILDFINMDIDINMNIDYLEVVRKLDNITTKVVDIFIDDFKKCSKNENSDLDRMLFYNKYYKFYEKCKYFLDDIKISGYGPYDFMRQKIKDKLQIIVDTFPHDWK